MRPLPFFTGGYYHLYNRGVDKRKIFLRYGHYQRFLTTIKSILDTGSATPRPHHNQGLALKSKITIFSHCLMPNHYHFLVQQTEDNGITEFMHNLNTSYTMYINLNLHRTGRLFEYSFKARAIESDEMLLHVSRYIHLNPFIAGLVDSPDLWPWSSYLETIGKREKKFCSPEALLYYFSKEHPHEQYEQFVKDQRMYAQLLHDAQQEKNGEDALFL